jgi:hypothetical protein
VPGDGEVGQDRRRCLEQAGEQLDEVAALLGGGAEHAGEDLPGVGACPGAVATPALAGNDGGADGLFGAQLVACTPGTRRNVNRCSRSLARWLSSRRLGG